MWKKSDGAHPQSPGDLQGSSWRCLQGRQRGQTAGSPGDTSLCTPAFSRRHIEPGVHRDPVLCHLSLCQARAEPRPQEGRTEEVKVSPDWGGSQRTHTSFVKSPGIPKNQDQQLAHRYEGSKEDRRLSSRQLREQNTRGLHTPHADRGTWVTGGKYSQCRPHPPGTSPTPPTFHCPDHSWPGAGADPARGNPSAVLMSPRGCGNTKLLPCTHPLTHPMAQQLQGPHRTTAISATQEANSWGVCQGVGHRSEQDSSPSSAHGSLGPASPAIFVPTFRTTDPETGHGWRCLGRTGTCPADA
ncbi:uncharacterized protein LOC104875628 [Fukomys damarensis]|uniref:uncharacterized protein LOC104875628 n=1 Tax=Fukomys damarensis TaxID=885580 RepID=UPI0005400048|nr:uncharacterized protein LOC104875628 [Fukomys damarensis]